jgi:hypothetical protein
VIDELPPEVRPVAKEALRIYLYRSSVEAWSRLALGVALDPWQRKLVETAPGKRVVALTHRQAGKTTGCAVAIAHTMLFGGETTSLILCPTQGQSAEGVRRVRQYLLKAGAKFKSDNAFSLELEGGSRVLALPGSDDSGIRGLSINGVLVLDEAARVSDELFNASLPMVLRYAKTARVLVASTAWAAQGFFYRLWTEGEGWIKVCADIHECSHLTPEDIERERRSMPAAAFRREYLCEFDQTETRFFNPESINRMFGLDDVLVPEVSLEGNSDEVVHRQGAFKNAFKELTF